MADETRIKLRPTIVTPPSSKPPHGTERNAALSRPSAPAALKPTAVIGAAREPLSVEVADLRRHSPGAAPDVVEGAIGLLRGFVVSKINDRKAILWGHDLQKRYSSAVAESLELSQSPSMRKMEGYVARTLQILEDFDLAAVAEERGGLGQIFKRVNDKIDTAGELSAARKELKHIAQLTEGTLDELVDLKGKIDQNVARLNEISNDVAASALAALYLSEHFKERLPDISERFTDRAMSLTQTLTQIRETGTVHDIQLQHSVNMISAVQNVVLVAMPGFLANLAALVSLAARNGRVSPTQAGELRFELRDIVRQLKG